MKTLLLVAALSLTACAPYYGYNGYGNTNGCPSTTNPNTGGAPSTNAGGGASGTYIVQPGDTLYSISRRFGVSPQAVMEKNRITNPSQLAVGQQLIL